MKPENIKILSDLKLSYQEIADITGKSVQSIRNQINKKPPHWLKVAIYVQQRADDKIKDLEQIIENLQHDKKVLAKFLKETDES